MRMTGAIFALLLAAVIAQPAAAKLRPASEADLRCLGLLASAASQSQGDSRTQAFAGVMYYLGRLDGAAPGIDLAKELRAIDKPMNREVVAKEGERCIAALNASSTRLQKFGEDMKPKP